MCTRSFSSYCSAILLTIIASLIVSSFHSTSITHCSEMALAKNFSFVSSSPDNGFWREREIFSVNFPSLSVCTAKPHQWGEMKLSENISLSELQHKNQKSNVVNEGAIFKQFKMLSPTTEEVVLFSRRYSHPWAKFKFHGRNFPHYCNSTSLSRVSHTMPEQLSSTHFPLALSSGVCETLHKIYKG